MAAAAPDVDAAHESDWFMGEAAPAPSHSASPRAASPTPQPLVSALRPSELSPAKSLLVAPLLPANLIVNSRGRRSCPDLDRVIQDGHVWFGSHEQGIMRARETGITRSEDIGELLKLRHSGPLLKKGFRGLGQWNARWLVLAGRRLFYYAHVSDEALLLYRGLVEITPRTEILLEDGLRFSVFPNGRTQATSWPSSSFPASTVPSSSNDSVPRQSADSRDVTRIQRPPPRPSPGLFGMCSGASESSSSGSSSSFSLLGSQFVSVMSGLFISGPGPNDPWHLEARTAEERDEWIRALRRSVFLVKREAMPATLMGVGSVHEHVEIGPAIGQGRFGVVHRAVTRFTRAEVAVKVVNKLKVIKSLEDARLLRNEIRVLRRIAQSPDHPNIVKTYQSYEDDAMLYTVRELLLGPTLEEWVRAMGPTTEAALVPLVVQIASALSVVHGLGIAVVDLSPAALRFDKSFNPDGTAPSGKPPAIKLVSFGLSIVVPPTVLRRSHGQELDKALATSALAYKESNIVTLSSVVGVPEYLPPESLSYRQFSTSSDVWSLGCLICYCLYGGPFDKAAGGPAPKIRMEWSMEIAALLGSMFHVDRTSRILAVQILRHPWIRAHPLVSSSFSLRPGSYRGKLRGAITVCILAISWSLAARHKRAVRVKLSQSSPNVASLGTRKMVKPGGMKRSSTLELNNSYLTLDSCAAKARQTAGEELDAFFKFGPGPDVRLRGSGMGITSSHAGQLSELANDHSSDTTSVRSTRVGAFLSALEAHLEMEAEKPGADSLIAQPSWETNASESVEF